MAGFQIAIVGDYYEEVDAQWQRPFSSHVGDELYRLLNDAGIERNEYYTTNVFNLRPASGDLTSLTCTKSSGLAIPGQPLIATGRYVQQAYAPELDRLYRELAAVRPNIIVCLGAVACWALLGQTTVGKLRGTVTHSTQLPGAKVLVTYHPRTILGQYENRHVTVLDLIKAKKESLFPELRRVDREIWLDPTLEDIESFYRAYVETSDYLSFDIETVAKEITCIGFAPSINRALVIPFHDRRKPTGSYWASLQEECKAWGWVRKYLATPAEKVAQNGMYDMSHLWHTYGIPTVNFTCDTMIRHHSIQPELPKGLDFLGSVYTNNPAWKQDRPRGKHTIKRDDE